MHWERKRQQSMLCNDIHTLVFHAKEWRRMMLEKSIRWDLHQDHANLFLNFNAEIICFLSGSAVSLGEVKLVLPSIHLDPNHGAKVQGLKTSNAIGEVLRSPCSVFGELAVHNVSLYVHKDICTVRGSQICQIISQNNFSAILNVDQLRVVEWSSILREANANDDPVIPIMELPFSVSR